MICTFLPPLPLLYVDFLTYFFCEDSLPGDTDDLFLIYIVLDRVLLKSLDNDFCYCFFTSDFR